MSKCVSFCTFSLFIYSSTYLLGTLWDGRSLGRQFKLGVIMACGAGLDLEVGALKKEIKEK